MKLFLKVLNTVITVGLVLVIGAAGALAFSARRSGDAIPSVLGHKVLTVISGSMEPAIMTGDVIIVKPVANPQAEIKDGDVITFRAKDDASMLITHRVVGTVLVNGTPAAFVTKGDANASEDFVPVSPEQVVGRYQWRVPLFGYLSSFLRKPLGIVLFVILPGLILIGLEFYKMWQAVLEAEKTKAEAAPTGEGGEQ